MCSEHLLCIANAKENTTNHFVRLLLPFHLSSLRRTDPQHLRADKWLVSWRDVLLSVVPYTV